MKRLHARRSARHVYVAVIALVAATAYVRSRPRSASLPLETSVDGPSPAKAAGVLVFLHGAVLKEAEVPVQSLEFDGEHKIPPEVISALVAFATSAQ